MFQGDTAVNNQRHRPVIYQRHIHHGAEPASLNRNSHAAHPADKIQVQAFGRLRRGNHLILVIGVNRNRFRSLAKCIGPVHRPVAMHAKAPAPARFLDPPAKRLRDQLVAETDADHGHARVAAGADEGLRRSDPVMTLVDAEFRPGDQPQIGGGRVLRNLAIQHRETAEFRPRKIQPSPYHF